MILWWKPILSGRKLTYRAYIIILVQRKSCKGCLPFKSKCFAFATFWWNEIESKLEVVTWSLGHIIILLNLCFILGGGDPKILWGFGIPQIFADFLILFLLATFRSFIPLHHSPKISVLVPHSHPYCTNQTKAKFLAKTCTSCMQGQFMDLRLVLQITRN